MHIFENKYYKCYYSIIANAKIRKIDNEQKYEMHHIIPKSLGGLDTADNLVALTLKEHWICHRLLVKFLKNSHDINKMYNALWMMLQKDYRTVNARIYKQVKENIIPWNKGKTGIKGHKIPEHVKEHLRKLHIGKKRKSEDIDKMKAGWTRTKIAGYIPWNKGVSMKPTRSIKCCFISPDGKEFYYNSQKEGCLAHNLPTSKMSEVVNNKLPHYKGWTVIRTVDRKVNDEQ